MEKELINIKTSFKNLLIASWITIIGLLLLYIFKPELQEYNVILIISYILIGISLGSSILSVSILSTPSIVLSNVLSRTNLYNNTKLDKLSAEKDIRKVSKSAKVKSSGGGLTFIFPEHDKGLELTSLPKGTMVKVKGGSEINKL